MTAMVHLVCGLTGAGKSTYSRRLQRDLTGVRFSIDEWNAGLFYVDQTPDSNFDWFYERVQRSCFRMRETATEIVSAGVPVVFDCGFTNRHEREIFYGWADAAGFETTLHWLDIDSDTRWSRVLNRNAEKGETHVMDVTREMFDFMETLWEAPDKDEMQRYNGRQIND